MLEREKVRTSAAITTALAASTENQLCPDGVAPSLQPPADLYACNPESVYSVLRIEPQEVEWIDPDSVDAEVSRLVAGSSATTTTTTTTTRNSQRRCCRTSTSSGYSSHSPPLSAGSYSCYATTIPGQGIFRASAPQTMKDHHGIGGGGGGLAVIHEGEAIPRPIWPSAFTGSREFYIGDDRNTEYDGMYACCGCSYAYSYRDWEYGRSSATSAREILLELSRTLNSVIEGETTMSPEEILQNISCTLTQSTGAKKSGVYEYVYHNPSWLLPNCKNSSSFLSSSRSTGNESTLRNNVKAASSTSSSSIANPVNSKLYGNGRQLQPRGSNWPVSRCACDIALKSLPNLARFERTLKEPNTEQKSTTERSRRDGNETTINASHYSKLSASRVCKCENLKKEGKICTELDDASRNTIVRIPMAKENRASLMSSTEPEYAMQLECSDGSSSEGMVVASSVKSIWNNRGRGFIADLDFTLDVTRAERLGRAIAKAKRKRQWCRVLTTFFGLVFFLLSVVVVSLSVTRGRKVFGSM